MGGQSDRAVAVRGEVPLPLGDRQLPQRQRVPVGLREDLVADVAGKVARVLRQQLRRVGRVQAGEPQLR